VHPAASPDVSDKCCPAIALTTELFPEPLSPKMTTFLARVRYGYILSVSFLGVGEGHALCECSEIFEAVVRVSPLQSATFVIELAWQ
jgi:hypothetical protein